MRETKKTNGGKQKSRKNKKVAKKITHLRAIAEKKAALNEKKPETGTQTSSSSKRLNLSPSAGSQATMKKLAREEMVPDAYSSAIAKGVNKSNLPSPNDRDGIRKRYRELTGGPALK